MDEIIREALSKGVEMHVAGEFDLASQLYASVIKLNPNHADANHNMGLLKLDMGHDLDALPYLQTALQADTTIAQFWISYIKALIQLGRHDEASRILNLAKENSFEGGEFVELQQQLNPLTTAKIAETEIKTSIQYEHNILNSLKLDKALKLAKKHVKEGSSEEALHIYRNILEKFPQNRTALKGLASVNKPKSSSVTDSPSQETVNQLINLYNQGKLEQVVEQAEALTQTYPEAFIIWNVLGTAQKDLGKLKEAVKTYSIAISIKPDFAEAYNNMGIALKNSGKLTEAIIAYEKASLIKPDYAEAHSNLANALYMQGKVDEAILAYEKAIRIKPDFVDAYINLGIIQKDCGKLDEVIKTFEKLLSIKPDHAESYLNIGNALQKKGKLDEAVKAYSRAIKIKPDFAEAFQNMGNAYKRKDKLQEATEAYKRAIYLKPKNPELYNNLGIILQNQEKLNQAIREYHRAISLKPNYAAAYKNLSELIKYERDDRHVAAVRGLLNQVDIAAEDRCILHYTYAKMNEDFDNIKLAYENYLIGGNLRKKLLRYHPNQDKYLFEKIKKVAKKHRGTFLKKSIEVARCKPIFIVGMPRSGTTLVEQIVSSHSHVYGAGELNFMMRFGENLALGLENINSASLLELRRNYLNKVVQISGDSRYFTDKMPQNFLLLGLIFRALPEAKIIHVKRDPAATCWSNFKHNFEGEGFGYSFSLEDTVNYFKLYQDLMEFWDQQYGKHIYHLDYDRLTLEQEPETRKLIEHLELDWEDNCLSPQENKRSLRTASQQQVRQKVYTGSSQAWRKFEPYLDGAFDKLLT